MVEERRGSHVLLQLVNDHRNEAVGGHERLRRDWRGHDARLDALEKVQTETQRHFDKLDAAPAPEITQLRFSWPVVVFIVTTFLTTAGGMWASTYGLRSDMRDILTRMDGKERQEALKETIQNERQNALRTAIDGADKQLKLQQIQIQELTNAVLDLKRSRQ